MAKKKKSTQKSGLGIFLLIILICAVLAVILLFGLGSMNRDRKAAAPTPAPEVSLEPEITPEPTPSPVPPTPLPMHTVEPFSTIAPTPEPERVENKLPYLIYVNYKAQLVQIYTLDGDGNYSIPVKTMITSSGDKRVCPTGTFKLHDRARWITFLDGSYGQYSTRITGHFLFHSIPYKKYNKHNTLISKDYDELGRNTSGGCMRLMCKDAKWIYENCPDGTIVIVSKGYDVDPAVYDTIVQPPLVSGNWDPTDPEPDNPDYFDESDATPPPTCNPYATPNPSPFANPAL